MRAARTITSRLVLLVALFAVALGATVAVASLRVHDRAMSERQEATRAVVETALGVVEHFAAEEAAGRLSRAEAQTAAVEAVRGLRYQGEEYFWINDMTPAMVMHPMKPELDGTDLTDSADPDGTHLFVEMVRVVEADGAGYVAYQWPKPGADAPQPKVSYVAGFEPWGWVLGSGVYVDDVRAAAVDEAVRLLVTGLALLAVAGGVSVWIGRGVVRPIRRATEVLSSGDVSVRLPEGGRRTELEKLAVALNQTLDRSAAVAADVSAAVLDLDAAASRLVVSSDEISTAAESADRQTAAAQSSAAAVSADIDTVAAGSEQMGASIQEIAHNANTVANVAAEAVAVAESTNRTVAELGESSAQIGSVVKVITSIAEQTNLLALNATIEAARAGEAGKGFAVVAGEVKDLAAETGRATEEIGDRVEAIQAAVAQAAEAIERVTVIIGSINDYQVTIAGAVEEQTATTAEISQSIARVAVGGRGTAETLDAVHRATRRTTDELAAIREAARDLAATSRRLRETVQAGTASEPAEVAPEAVGVSPPPALVGV